MTLQTLNRSQVSSHRPLPHHAPHLEAGLGAQTMLSPPKQGKIIKLRTVNSFCHRLWPLLRTLRLPSPQKPQEAPGLQGLRADCPCIPRPQLSPWEEERRRLGLVEQPQGKAFPTILPPQSPSPGPLPMVAQG